ncbi:LHFPL tetraspan subfamily member 3 protein isoform X1 [Brienomyrus brachyistius]|uniref:LHFPL tetraspan subfamily member 3 protein isoform X1 n=2 Tax=Brienomyrus brachyistius TaxID=42636 RepID=UPI0020B1C8C2|nr:LHFPL tetraspan subfamily member 3 protein isoform X1 [Brienomyrus brachyistius]XP_048873200.1 LHFPL tetraspan subfamily member 3 protein isoform X1 [Brienomyrus brachyistius]
MQLSFSLRVTLCVDCHSTGTIMQPQMVEVARLYQTEFIRSARAVGALWAVCTLCFAVIEVVILVQPSWVGTRELHYEGGASPPPAGTLGLFEVCLESDWPVPECRGSLATLTPLPAFQSPAVLVCISLTMVWVSVGCLVLFRFCNAATVYKICAWLQLTAGFCLALACVLFPDSWDCSEMRGLCGEGVSSFSPGNCTVHWGFVLAMLGVLDAAILATLAFVLGNRQDALLPQYGKDVTGLLLPR